MKVIQIVFYFKMTAWIKQLFIVSQADIVPKCTMFLYVYIALCLYSVFYVESLWVLFGVYGELKD